MKTSIAVLALAAAAITSSPAGAEDAVSPERAADVKKLLEISGALQFPSAIAQEASAQISKTVKDKRPDVPPEAFTIISEEVNKVVGEEVTRKGGYSDQLIQAYAKYLTAQDVKGLLQFYNSPVGRKFTATLPMLGREAVQVNQRFVQTVRGKLAPRLSARLGEKGINLDAPGQAPAPAAAPPAK